MGKTQATPPAADVAGRRRFLKLVAGSAAAIMVGTMAHPRVAGAQTESAKKKQKAPKRTEKIEAELKNQRDYVASTLKTIRGFELPPGSEAGYAFRPVRKSAPHKRRKSR